MRTAVDCAARWLKTRDYSEAALRERLVAKGFAPADVDAAIAWARDYGGLSDARLSARRAETRRAQGYAPAYIAGELSAIGVAEPLAARAAAENAADVRVRAAALLQRHRARFASEPRRALAFLARRGFDEEVARHALAEVFSLRLDDAL